MRSPCLPDLLVPLLERPSTSPDRQGGVQTNQPSNSKPFPSTVLSDLALQHPGRAVRVRFIHHGEFLDEALLFLWPPSPSRPDWHGELHLHGGVWIVERVLSALEETGCRVISEKQISSLNFTFRRRQ